MTTTNHTTEFRAIVVDDDPIVRQMVSFALAQEGFACESAEDGERGFQLLSQNSYDLLVTDLQMPNRNGHALSVEILESDSRPVIIIHSSITEPRITRDLLTRGVDDIVFKPADYPAFAVKARTLVERRRSQHQLTESNDNKAANSEESNVAVTRHSLEPVSPREVQRRLATLNKLIPLPRVAFDTYFLAMAPDTNVTALAVVMEQDASLAAELLKLANSAYFNPGAGRIDSVDKAIIRLGRRMTGEVALSAGAQLALAGCSAPWINRDLAWRRGLATAAAVNITDSLRAPAKRNGSLFLSGLMYPVGRIALATLFPEEHQELVEYCQQTGASLDVMEEQIFGLTYGQAGARLLAAWRLPPATRLPLEHVARTFDELIALPVEIREDVEVIKLSMLLGQTVVGVWEPWDVIDIPRMSLLKRHRITSIPYILQTVSEKLNSAQSTISGKRSVHESSLTTSAIPSARYLSSDTETEDLLRPLLASTGLQFSEESDTQPGRHVINGLSVESAALQKLISFAGTAEVYGIVRTPEDASLFADGKSICLPATVQEVRQCIFD